MTEVVAGGETLYPSHVISSLPLRTTVGITEPEAPLEVRDAARGLRYREFLTVLLVIDVDDPFDDNWIYIHQPGVRVLRIQNFKSWSPWMVPKGETASSIGMEYFCFEGDELWNMADDDLVAMAGQEIEKLHLAQASKVRFGFVERVHKAYPIYDELYGERVKTIRGWLETITNLTQVGRNGLHRYNNSDHSMLTAMRAVDNILRGHPPRHLGGQRRERLPRGAPGERGPLPAPADHSGHGAAARLRAMRRPVALLLALVLLAAAPGAALAATTAKSGGKSGSGSGGAAAEATSSSSASASGSGGASPQTSAAPATGSTAPVVPITPNGSTNPLSGGVSPVSPSPTPTASRHDAPHHQRHGADQRRQLAVGRQRAGHRHRRRGRPGWDRLLHLP